MEAQHVIYVYLKITHYARLCNKIHKIMEEIKLGINIQTPIQWHIGKKKKIRDDTKSESVGHSVKSDSFQTHGLQPSRLLSPWNSPGKNTGVGSQPFTSPGDLPNPGFDLGLLDDGQILCHLSHQEDQENVIHIQWLRIIYDYGIKYSASPRKRLKFAYGIGQGKGESL